MFDAIRQSAAVRFDYRGERRHVDVAGLRFRNGRWYVIGFDRDRGEARTFRVDRIAGLPELDEPDVGPGSRPASTSIWPSPATRGSSATARRSRSTVLVDGAESARVVAELGEEAVVEHRDGGAVVVRLSVTDQEALILWVLDLLDHAEVLAPDAVRAAVVDRLEAIAGHR